MDNPNNPIPPSQPSQNPSPDPLNNPLPNNTPLTDPANFTGIPTTPQPPTPTFDSTTNINMTPPTSPVDNPWGNPINAQPTPPQQEPAWAPSATQSEQLANPSPSFDSTPQPAPTPLDSTPTDLSHLIGNNQTESIETPQPSSETLVVPPQPTMTSPDTPTVPTQEHKGIPKWLIGVGIGLVIIVAGASAYFILGIGQNPQNAESVPAEVSNTTVRTAPPVTTPPQAVAPAASSIPAATGSANFGELQGSDSQPQASSAADRLRQRQGN